MGEPRISENMLTYRLCYFSHWRITLFQAVISLPLFGDTCATKGINGEGDRFKELEEDSLTQDYLPNN